MESFEDLGLGPELVEALSSEGMEEPTPFQVTAIPVIRRGNNLLGRAGPGAGTLVAYGAALLDRLETGSATPRALVVTASSDSARALAEALAGLAGATGHVVAAVGSPWALPQRADILFGTASELTAWAQANRFDPNAVDVLVVDQASTIQRMGGLPEIEALLAFLPKEGQRVVLALPMSKEIEDFVERHARRAVQVPPKAVEAAATTQRGEVRYRIVEEPKDAGALQLVSELLEDARHCCLFFAHEDGAADVGDYLTLHGFAAGAPGDAAAPVWLAVRELAARDAEQDGVVAVSYDAPAGPDSLDRRHGGGRGGVVVVAPREMPHLRDVAKATGYKVVPFPPTAPAPGRGEFDQLLARLEEAAGEADLAPYLVALEPLFARRSAAEVAAAAVALLRQRTGPESTAATAAPLAHKAAAPKPRAGAAEKSAPRGTAGAPPAAFVRLFVSLGERDDVRQGDIVGAVTGESGIQGSQIGKIDLRDTFSIVEVEESVAETVIRALNGVTVRGRSVRVDYDRARPGGREARGPAGPRVAAGAGGPRERPDRGDRGPERSPRPSTSDRERPDRGAPPKREAGRERGAGRGAAASGGRERADRGSVGRDRPERSTGSGGRDRPTRDTGSGGRDRPTRDAGSGGRDRPTRDAGSGGRDRPTRDTGSGGRDRPARSGSAAPGKPRGGPRERSTGHAAPKGGRAGAPRSGPRGADDRPGRGEPRSGPPRGGPPRKGGAPSRGGPPRKGGPGRGGPPKKGGRPPRS